MTQATNSLRYPSSSDDRTASMSARQSAATAPIRRPVFWDVALLLIILLGGALIGSRYIERVGAGEFVQSEFGAAVSLACGHGFAEPLGPPPALSDFLNRRASAFSCDQWPPGLSVGPPTFLQRLYRYLMTAVAFQWMWSGVSWHTLAPLFGAMFGLTLAASYALFRLAGGPLVATIAVIPLAISSHQLATLPRLRDYAKAPFILLLILVMAHLARPPYSRRRCLLLAAAFGLILGVGFGFRNDLLVNVPPFVAVVLLLVPVRWRDELRVKAACLGLALVTFAATAWPILIGYRSGSNTGHAAVCGLTSAFDAPLGLTRPVYDLGSPFLDGYCAAVINAHHYLRRQPFVEYLSPEYDAAAVALIADVTRHWPADIFVRGVASVLQVLDFPFSVGRYGPPVPDGVTAPPMRRTYEVQADVLRTLAGLGSLLVTAAAVVVGSVEPRAAVALVLMILYYCGYPAIQFQVRHFFHLEFIAWWALAFLAAKATRSAWRFISVGALPRPNRRAISSALVGLASIVVVTVLPLWILRAYQQRHLVTLFDAHLQAQRTPLSLTRATASGWTRVTMDGLWSRRAATEPLSVRHLVAEATADRCGTIELPVRVVYDARTPSNDFSSVTRMAIDPSGPTALVIPVYYNGEWSHFVGFDLPEGYDTCLKSVSLIDDLSGILVPVELTLAPTWRSKRLFQRLATWESEPASNDAHPLVRVQPADLIVSPDSHVSRAVPLWADHLAPGVTESESGRGWTGNVHLDFPQQTLVHFPTQSITAGLVLRAKGVLHHGGLQVGVLENDRLIDSHSITTPGPFTALIQEPNLGTYGVRVADFALPEWRMEPRSVLREVAWFVAPWLRVDVFELQEMAWIKPGL